MKKEISQRTTGNVFSFPAFLLIVLFCLTTIEIAMCDVVEDLNVSLYRLFELPVINTNAYENKFTDVELVATYTAPSGNTFEFPGFYDGDGSGGGDLKNGDVWKIRFMPNEEGTWTYEYKWSDGADGGSGAFICVAEGAGKGVLQAYKSNPHWLAYNGTDPVWIKSYYETGHGAIGQDFDWIVENVYSRLVDAGYNHLQVNWLLSLCCYNQRYLDGPAPEISDMALYKNGQLFSTMNFDVWRRMEQHLGWLNDNDVGVHMFLGVDGSKNSSAGWANLSSEEQDWFAKYMVARLAPFANLAGWNFVWEVPGDTEEGELGFARLIQKYDIFGHLRTYEDEEPRDNEYSRDEYNFAAIENHQIIGNTRDTDRVFWKEPYTHHMASILGYKNKPVYMSEGNSLWRRYWQAKLGTNRDQLRRAAWGCATGGASFNWCGHTEETGLYAYGPDGLPFEEDNEYLESEKQISILTRVMNEEVEFYRMLPHDDVLVNYDPFKVWALAASGQYLAFSTDGESFGLLLRRGNYGNNIWLDAKTGAKMPVEDYRITVNSTEVTFEPPNTNSDWVLILRTDETLAVEDSDPRNDDTEQIPKNFRLYQNFPNPFNAQTTIQYDLQKAGFVELAIFNLSGQEIAVLEKAYKSAGRHSVSWNMEGMASGMYVYKLKVGSMIQIRKLVALK